MLLRLYLCLRLQDQGMDRRHLSINDILILYWEGIRLLLRDSLFEIWGLDHSFLCSAFEIDYKVGSVLCIMTEYDIIHD